MHMHICGLSGSTIFFHIIPLMVTFLKKVTEYTMCFVILYNCLQHFSLYEEVSKMIKKCIFDFISSTCYCRILIKLEFSQQIFKNYSNINFMKIHPVGGELFHTDSQTHMMKLTVTFHNFENAPKNYPECN
jgi:hypothetical protein